MERQISINTRIPILCIVKAYDSVGVDPKIIGIVPIVSTKKALNKAGWTVEDLDLIEANEAFVSQ